MYCPKVQNVREIIIVVAARGERHEKAVHMKKETCVYRFSVLLPKKRRKEENVCRLFKDSVVVVGSI